MAQQQDFLKVAIVTGASEGIGKAITSSLLQANNKVIMLARDEAKLKLALCEMGSLAKNAWVLPVDLTFSRNVNMAIEMILQREGRIDCLVNNLGNGLQRTLIETTDQEWDHMVHVNLSSAFYACRAVIPVMRKVKHGWIVNISSRSGRRGEGQFAAYCAVKHGLVGLTRALADSESEFGIHVNAICPGPVATEKMIERHPMMDRSNWNTTLEVAQSVLFLLSPAAEHMNGQCVDLFMN